MDLSFINLPASQEELLAVLRMAYQAGQNSVGAVIKEHTKWTGDYDTTIKFPVTVKKYKFKHWLTRLATQWEDIKHS
jgi:hypothetical protein